MVSVRNSNDYLLSWQARCVPFRATNCIVHYQLWNGSSGWALLPQIKLRLPASTITTLVRYDGMLGYIWVWDIWSPLHIHTWTPYTHSDDVLHLAARRVYGDTGTITPSFCYKKPNTPLPRSSLPLPCTIITTWNVAAGYLVFFSSQHNTGSTTY